MMKQFIIYLIALMMTSLFTVGTIYAAQPETAHKVRLLWNPIPDAVMYELTLTSRPGGRLHKEPAKTVLVKSDIYTPGTELDLNLSTGKPGSLWWQVRALNFDRQPISGYTEPRRVSAGEFDPASPFVTTYGAKELPAKLYQVYSWIPVLHAGSYEIEISAASPAGTKSREVVRTKVIDGATAFDWYDETPYTTEGTYWWRVRARDGKGGLLTGWSQSVPVVVKSSGFKVAALGDSVTHGGGAVSNPPSNPAYDWTTYAGFPIKNLGHSGDTTGKMAARFESEVLPFKPRLLVVMGGVNDLRGGSRAAEVIGNLTTIREKCRQAGIIPVFATVTPVNPAAIKQVFNQDTAADWQAEWQQVNEWVKCQPYYVDVAAPLMDAQGLLAREMATDGLHPDTKGKALIGKAIGAYLNKNFSKMIK